MFVVLLLVVEVSIPCWIAKVAGPLTLIKKLLVVFNCTVVYGTFCDKVTATCWGKLLGGHGKL